jgi:hypothetical protein
MFIKKALTIAALSTIATVAYAGSAQAISFTYSAGSVRTQGVTNEGSFSPGDSKNQYTVNDFNNGEISNGILKYTTQTGTYSKVSGTVPGNTTQTGVYSDVWAPAGVKGEVNESKYLAVFEGNSVTIETIAGQFFNYFGFNAGALSGGNVIEFFKGTDLVKKLTYDDMTKLAPTAAAQHGGEKNGFFEFFSEGDTDNFNRIVLSQVGGGGFETDNHTLRVGQGKYTASVPEPGIVLGLAGIGSIFLKKRKNQSVA